MTAAPLDLARLGASDDRPAVVEPGRGAISYAELDCLANAVAHRWRELGLPPGARVGLYLRRSIDAIAAMLGTLRAGCAYVPVDTQAPVDRLAEIHAHCGVHATLVEERFHAAYRDALHRIAGREIAMQQLRDVGLGRAVQAWANNGQGAHGIAEQPSAVLRPDLACLLYTSGTTGRPKGWMMSRAAIAAHANWSHRLLTPTRDDTFANHAPFSFGMSLFDIYSSLGCGARLVLVPDSIRQHGGFVADMIAAERVTIWFSGPAILSLVAELPDLESRDVSSLRVIAFAGEVFPLRHLKALRARLPGPRYFNFYGSTETNVALFFELPRDEVFDERPPIGHPCDHYKVCVAHDDGTPVPPGQTGELWLRGPGLETGYWGEHADRGPWFRTKDLVVTLPSGDLRYAGRIGRMIKLRGYRVEPGEIEARLYQHDAIKEVGVVPVESPAGIELVAHLTSVAGTRPSVVELREFCAVKLPPYMIPARFVFHVELPRTSSGKIDLQGLRALAAAP